MSDPPMTVAAGMVSGKHPCVEDIPTQKHGAWRRTFSYPDLHSPPKDLTPPNTPRRVIVVGTGLVPITTKSGMLAQELKTTTISDYLKPTDFSTFREKEISTTPETIMRQDKDSPSSGSPGMRMLDPQIEKPTNLSRAISSRFLRAYLTRLSGTKWTEKTDNHTANGEAGSYNENSTALTPNCRSRFLKNWLLNVSDFNISWIF